MADGCAWIRVMEELKESSTPLLLRPVKRGVANGPYIRTHLIYEELELMLT